MQRSSHSVRQDDVPLRPGLPLRRQSGENIVRKFGIFAYTHPCFAWEKAGKNLMRSIGEEFLSDFF